MGSPITDMTTMPTHPTSMLRIQSDSASPRPQLQRKRTELSNRQVKYLSIAIKMDILCSVCIIVTNVHFCGWILFSLGVFEKHPIEGLHFEMVWETLWKVVLIINFTC